MHGCRRRCIKANVAKARAVIAVTSDDATNLGVTLEVKQTAAHVRTVTRVRCGTGPQSADGLSVDAAFGASLIAATDICGRRLLSVCPKRLCAGQSPDQYPGSLCGTEWEGRRPSQLRADNDVSILMRKRPDADRFESATEDTPLSSDERVLAVVWRTLRERPRPPVWRKKRRKWSDRRDSSAACRIDCLQ